MKSLFFIFGCLFVFITEYSAQSKLNEGLIAYYNFDNNCDDLCLKHSLVFANNAFTSDVLNRPQSAAHFDGSQYIEIVDANDLTFDQNIFSISCWVRCDDTSKTGAILSKRNPWGNFEYSLDNGMDKKFWVFDHWTNGGKNAVYGSDPFKSKVILEQGVWQHIVYTSNNIELCDYMNGVKSVGVDFKNSGMNFENTTSNFCIG
ncbi:MAG: hypothetical protein HYZ42_06055, partial [Bacteroidetes bacterium]|nr:hypothetical protein [Bacteroidota bacterium]